MEKEKSDVGGLFDRISTTYDRINHILSLNIDKSWRRKAVKGLAPVEKCLDVAVGTGDLAIEIVRQNKADYVQGIDLSTQMMAVGKQKVEKSGLSDRIGFQEGSALELPYDTGSFQALTCAYGVRNFSNLDKGLSEMCRVLSSGGQLMILEFSYPSNPLVRWAYNFYFSHIMPLIGKLISKDPSAYTYFCNSVKNFIWGQEMVNRIEAAGFENASFRTLTFGITTIYSATKK